MSAASATPEPVTNREKQLHFLRLAEKAKNSAALRRRQIAVSQERDLIGKWGANLKFYRDRNFEHELTEKVNKAASSDPLWKGHVADNQWFMQQAIMYGIAATNDLLHEFITRQS